MRVHSRTRPRGDGGSFWTSYSDMMAGLMLVFALVMVFSIFQLGELERLKSAELTEKENLLNEQEDLLLAQRNELDLKQITLDDQSEQLASAVAALGINQAELDARNLQLQALQAQIDSAQANLLAQQQQLADKEGELAAAQSLLSDQQMLMSQQQEKLDKLIGVRSRIIEDLRDELRKASLDVTVDVQTGAITLKGAVLFEVNKSTLTPGGMNLLDSFIPVYVRTLLAQGNSEYVAEIMIEGHTDTDGTYLDNLRLSQDRAYAVTQYCLQDGFGGLTAQERELLRNIMTANGRSWSNPIYQADGSVNMEASRRVEFKFRLKDAEMISEMSAIMEGQ